jgi:hypothetical protein
MHWHRGVQSVLCFDLQDVQLLERLQLDHTLQMHGKRASAHVQLLIRTLTQELSGRITDPLAIRLRERVLPMRCESCTLYEPVQCGCRQVLPCMISSPSTPCFMSA